MTLNKINKSITEEGLCQYIDKQNKHILITRSQERKYNLSIGISSSGSIIDYFDISADELKDILNLDEEEKVEMDNVFKVFEDSYAVKAGYVKIVHIPEYEEDYVCKFKFTDKFKQGIRDGLISKELEESIKSEFTFMYDIVNTRLAAKKMLLKYNIYRTILMSKYGVGTDKLTNDKFKEFINNLEK